MKCIPKKYTDQTNSWDQYNYSYEFQQFESEPTATEYNFVHVLPDSKVYEEMDNLVVFLVELPNCMLSGILENIDVIKYDHKVKKVITNCPFSVKFFNDRYQYDKFIYGYIPYNPKYQPPLDLPRIYDVYHTGHSHNSAIRHFYPTIEKFNSCFVSADYGNHKNVGYREKLLLNAQSKISIIHNIMKWPSSYISNILPFKPFHGAFEFVNELGIVPQMKTRVFEAIQSKSIMLCHKDPWNIIESYFTENEDFIYWTDAKDLEEKIHHILAHYDEYLPMAERALKNLEENFTIRHFFDTYLRPL